MKPTRVGSVIGQLVVSVSVAAGSIGCRPTSATAPLVPATDEASRDPPVGFYVAAPPDDKPQLVLVARGDDDTVWVYRGARYFAARAERDPAGGWRLVPRGETDPTLTVRDGTLQSGENVGLEFSRRPDLLTAALGDGPIALRGWVELPDALAVDPSLPTTTILPNGRILLALRRSREGPVERLSGVVVPDPRMQPSVANDAGAGVQEAFIVTGPTLPTSDHALATDRVYDVPDAVSGLRMRFDEDGKLRTAVLVGYMSIFVLAAEHVSAATVEADVHLLLDSVEP